jgi:hypothetical protein
MLWEYLLLCSLLSSFILEAQWVSLSLSYCYCYSSCENGVKQGLWMGIICGLSVQVMALVMVNICTDWNHEVRIFQST